MNENFFYLEVVCCCLGTIGGAAGVRYGHSTECGVLPLSLGGVEHSRSYKDRQNTELC